jgi:hypothetical protein
MVATSKDAEGEGGAPAWARAMGQARAAVRSRDLSAEFI